METDPNLDFSEFDRDKHAGVLLDGVGDAMILKGNRESLQGRAKVIRNSWDIFFQKCLSVKKQTFLFVREQSVGLLRKRRRFADTAFA